MYWQNRLDQPDPNAAIEQRIIDIFDAHNGNYGYRRITAVLRQEGWAVNKKKVQRLMRINNLKSISYTRKSRQLKTYRGHVGTLAPNRVNQRFETPIVHQKVTTDTTKFKYYDISETGSVQVKKLYLDPFLDMYNREIISYRVSPRPSAEGIMEALNEAIDQTSDCPYRRTFHSDQGWAYQMKAYTTTLKEHQIFQSMSRKGNCIDNSPMENFFGIMKQEMYYGHVYNSYDELKQAIDRFITYYNETRIKAKLGHKSPVQYRLCDQSSPSPVHG